MPGRRGHAALDFTEGTPGRCNHIVDCNNPDGIPPTRGLESYQGDLDMPQQFIILRAWLWGHELS